MYHMNISNEEKTEILNYITSNVNFNNYRYKIMTDTKDLQYLNNMKYTMPNYCGINCILVFVKIRTKYYSVMIEKKSIVTKMNIDHVKITSVKYYLTSDIYKGSIFDGMLLLNNHNLGKSKFIINDVYKFFGNNVQSENLKTKFMNVSSYFKNNVSNNSDVHIVVNSVYDINLVKNVIENYSKSLPFNNFIKGIAFVPEISGDKSIFLFKNSVECGVENNARKNYGNVNNKNGQNKCGQNKYDRNKCDQNTNLVFRLKKMGVDVYDMSLAEIYYEDNKKYVKYKNCGIALISTKECSAYCKQIFDEKLKQTLLFECKYVDNKKKWEPVKYVDGTLPSNYNELKIDL